MSNNLTKKILAGLSLVGPGLFLIGYNIGTGSVTTMAKAGAEYGMTLFWALVLSCIFTYILMVAYGQVTLVSGQTALYNIKTRLRYGLPLAIYILIALILGELLALMGIMGIVTDLLQEGIRLLDWGEVNTLGINAVLVVGLFVLLFYGRYQLFEKILTFFVILMGLCFLLVFFLVRPDFGEIARGLIPSIPDQPGAFGLVAAMAGTTCSAAVFVIRSIVVAEKGWNITNLKSEKRDAFVSAGMMLFLSGVIMAVGAGTLHVMGLKLTDTVEMIQLFEPIGGKVAALALILGITGAGLSTIFPIILIAPWLISDLRGTPRDIRSPLFRMLGSLGLLASFGLQFIDERPPTMMVFSQAFQACILPAVTIPIMILINQSSVMGEHVATPKTNRGLWAVLIFSLATTYFALAELF
jgi:Mn2+/Fe2+ NRAMP family transporter